MFDLGERHTPRLRCVAVGIVATAVAAGLARLLAPEVVPGPGGRPFADQLVWLCAVAGLAGAAWLWLLTLLVAVEALGGAPTIPAAPAPLRRLVLAACGIALVGAAPAAATAHADLHAPRSVVLAGLPLPDRAEGASAVANTRAAGTTRTARAPDGVLVRPGDTLWALAERSLPPGAGDRAVTAGWQRIYDLNRARIGPDPDLIHPGQRLRLPPP
jgi:hypothetical protein